MPLPLEDHVRAVVLEHRRAPQIHKVIREAWQEFTERYPERHLWVRKATSRNLFWESVIRRLRIMAASDPGMEIIEHCDTVSVVFDDEVLMRLKHADTALMTQNVPTGDAVNFDRHEVDLFGRPGLQRVRLCYVLNEYETQILWTGIAAHSDGRFLWKIEVDTDGLVAAPVRLPIDAPEVDTTRLARLKDSARDDEQKKRRNDDRS